RVRYCFHAILSVADPSALPKNRRLTQDELKARIKPMTPDQAIAARDRLEALVNALPEASVLVPAHDRRAALDGRTRLDPPPATPGPARASRSRQRPGPGPAWRGPRRHRRPRARQHRRPRTQDRVARLRPRLHPGPSRALPPPGPGPGLLPGHGLPRRPARHP